MMEDNKLDTVFKDKLVEREIQPSSSAWERLSYKLEEEEVKRNNKQKKHVFKYIASIILLMSTGMLLFKSITKDRVEAINLQAKNIEFIKGKTEYVLETVLVVNELHTKPKKNKIKDTIRFEKEIETKIEVEKRILRNEDKLIVKEEFENKELFPLRQNSIQVRGADLLYAVTHSSKEVKEYYAKNKLKRSNVLDTIKVELKKSNLLTINPEVLLAEAEESILKDNFRGNLIYKIKLKISDIAMAVADRNKE